MKSLYEYICEALSPLTTLFNYIKQNQKDSKFALRKPVKKKRQLLFYFTGFDDGKYIMKHGFTHGTSLQRLGYSSRGVYENGDYITAYDEQSVRNDLKTLTDNGHYMIVLGADCVKCKNQRDNNTEYVFVRQFETSVVIVDCVFNGTEFSHFETIDEKHVKYYDLDELLSDLRYVIFNKLKIEI